jgi:hypothetical protein
LLEFKLKHITLADSDVPVLAVQKTRQTRSSGDNSIQVRKYEEKTNSLGLYHVSRMREAIWFTHTTHLKQPNEPNFGQDG